MGRYVEPNRVSQFQEDGTEGQTLYVWNNSISEWAEFRNDGVSDAIPTIDYSHHKIHSGSHYFYRESHDIARNATLDHLIVTPDTTKWAHMTIAIENTVSQVLIMLYRATTVSANGTLEDSFNRNQNVADDNTTEIYETPTIISVGTELATWTLGSGKNLPGGAARDSEEIILKQGENYLVRVIEPNVSATTVNITFDWYEHTSKT